jgi:hypothetical protein
MIERVPAGQLLRRGLHRLPVLGPHGETVLVAITSGHQLTPSSPYAIPEGSDPDTVAAWLWEELDRIDPVGRAVPRHLKLEP